MPADEVAHWRCFHCDETFTDPAMARLHFGASIHDSAACQVGDARLRELEQHWLNSVNEDTELHRAIYRLQSEHTVALRRAEEAGYANALRDLTAMIPDFNELLKKHERRT